MTILVAEKDCKLQGLSFVMSLNMAALSHRGLHPPQNPITAAVFRKAIKDTHCIKFIFANEHCFKQIMQRLIKKYLPKTLHTQLSSYFLAFCNYASVCCVPK
jgi:hypothetical protein